MSADVGMRMHKQLSRKHTKTIDGDQTWAQVGWIGQSGLTYGLDEPINEPGSFAPLWLLIENSAPVPDVATELGVIE